MVPVTTNQIETNRGLKQKIDLSFLEGTLESG